MDRHRAEALRCPRCGVPIACSLGERAEGVRVEAAVRLCRCPLDEAEWDMLKSRLAALRERRDIPD
jgi:hypothetical protein